MMIMILLASKPKHHENRAMERIVHRIGSLLRKRWDKWGDQMARIGQMEPPSNDIPATLQSPETLTFQEMPGS